MVVIENLEDGLRYFSLVVVVRVQPDLHLGFADRHEAHCEAGTHSCETCEQEGDQAVEVEERRRRRNEWFIIASALEGIADHNGGKRESERSHSIKSRYNLI